MLYGAIDAMTSERTLVTVHQNTWGARDETWKRQRPVLVVSVKERRFESTPGSGEESEKR